MPHSLRTHGVLLRRLIDHLGPGGRAGANDRRASSAQGQAASDQLNEATRRLERAQNEQMAGAARDLSDKARQLAEEQKKIGNDVNSLGTAPTQQQVQELIDRIMAEANTIIGQRLARFAAA